MIADPYPLRFQPFFRDYIWGGRNLGKKLHKPIPPDGIWAESWEVVDHAEHDSVISNGKLAGQTLGKLLRSGGADWLCGSATFSGGFPLLLKYLDCQRVLSVQVHPNDDYAKKMTPPDLGKTEAWYIIDAEPDSLIYAGLLPGVGRAELANAMASGKTEECLATLKPKAGDCVFIPAGTVHALGSGLLVAEIQQASNTTFRLFDWNRLDASGKSRPLHIDQSLDTVDYASGPRPFQTPEPLEEGKRERLVRCDKFVFDRLVGSGARSVGGDNRFHILTLPRGSATILFGDEMTRLGVGESVLLPAALDAVTVELAAESIVLDMTLP